MQIEPQRYLQLIEQANGICFFDIESTGLRGDYNSVLVVSVKPYLDPPITLTIKQVGNDQKLVREAKELLEQFDCWVGYYSKGFDVPMLNTRLLKWGQQPIEKRLHLDMYYSLKANILTSRRSQGHLLNWLGTPEQKMSVGADTWSEMPFKLQEHLPKMVERCESDVIGLQELYDRTKHVIGDLKK